MLNRSFFFSRIAIVTSLRYNVFGDSMQRYFSQKLEHGYFELSKEDQYHITVVMRLKQNDQVEVVYENVAYLGCIENVNEKVQIKCIQEVQKEEQKIPEIILCIPLLKEQKMDFIIQKATELGASKIIPIRLERSIIKLSSEKLEKKLERWNRISKEASEQSKRLSIPKVERVMDICDLEKIDGLKLVCSTTSENFSLQKLLQSNPSCDRIVIVVGPEGGLTKKEETELLKNGFLQVRLGKNIMRVETVPIFFLSVINYEYME